MSPNFVTLPLEIRNEIYSHVFHYRHIRPYRAIYGRMLHFSSRRDDLFGPLNPKTFFALLEVSHQISNEAATFFYSNIRFCGGLQHIAAFVKGIGARRRDLIRRVEIKHRSPTDSQFRDDIRGLLGALPKLRTARIVASVHDFTRLQNQLIQSDIWQIDDMSLSNGKRVCGDVYLKWSAMVITRRKGGSFNRNLLPAPPGESGD